MAKRLFLLLIAGLFGVVNAPGVLMATDSVDLTGLDNSNVVETVPLPEPVKVAAPVVVAKPAAAPAAPASGAAVPAAPAMVNYTVSVYTADIVEGNLSYSTIYKTEKLLYAHNSQNLFGNLGSLAIGQTFTVTEGGMVQPYRVAAKVTYAKTADGYLENDMYLMGRIVDTAMGHSIALMTCAGTPYGNGDASHRLVVYADAA